MFSSYAIFWGVWRQGEWVQWSAEGWALAGPSLSSDSGLSELWGCPTMPSPHHSSPDHCIIEPTHPKALRHFKSLSISLFLSLLYSFIVNWLFFSFFQHNSSPFFCSSLPTSLCPPTLCLLKTGLGSSSLLFLNAVEWHKTDDHKSTS